MYSADEKQADTQLRLARSYAAKHLPWFSPALFRCRLIFSERVPVAAIDTHYNVYWNPATVKVIAGSTNDRKRVLEELAFIWIHEISHVLREHGSRAKSAGYAARRWNYAADLEINDGDWPGTRHPTLFPPVLPTHYQLPDGRLAEWYYQQLAPQPAGPRPWDDGSGAHGVPAPWELDEGEKQTVSTLAKTVLRRAVARELQAQAPGKLPGTWGQWIKHTLEPRIDWRKLLRKRLATAIMISRGSKTDYSYAVIHRRATVFRPIVRPALAGSSQSRITVVVDTSGSMTGVPIERAVAEIYGLLTQLSQQVTLLPCDARSFEPIRLRVPRDILRLLQLPGGGGTNMIHGIEAALTRRPAPDTILVLTDGYTPFPAQRYAVPVVWGIIGPASPRGNNLPPNPPWSADTVVRITTEHDQ